MPVDCHTSAGFQLIDVSNHLPGLVYRTGLTSWKPTAERSADIMYASYDDYMRSIPEDQRQSSKMAPTHWPPTATEVAELHLDRWYATLEPFGFCTRV